MRKDTRDLPLCKMVYDGVYERTIVLDGKQVPTKEYDHWHHMQTRCKEPYWKSRPSYWGYSMSDYFSDYNNFAAWCKQQPFNTEVGFTLEKDIINVASGTKVYSEETCVFVPAQLNSFLTTKRKNVKVFTGVSFQKACGKYIVSCSQLNGKNKTLARVHCPIEGYQIYRQEKVRLAKLFSEQHGDKLDKRVMDILSNFSDYIDLFTVNPNNKE